MEIGKTGGDETAHHDLVTILTCETYGHHERGNVWDEERFKGQGGKHVRHKGLGTLTNLKLINPHSSSHAYTLIGVGYGD